MNEDITLSVQIRTTFESSVTTKSTHFKEGSLRREICFLTIASNAMSGVNNPTYGIKYCKNIF